MDIEFAVPDLKKMAFALGLKRLTKFLDKPTRNITNPTWLAAIKKTLQFAGGNLASPS